MSFRVPCGEDSPPGALSSQGRLCGLYKYRKLLILVTYFTAQRKIKFNPHL
jgi:hypothetical protein